MTKRPGRSRLCFRLFHFLFADGFDDGQQADRRSCLVDFFDLGILADLLLHDGIALEPQDRVQVFESDGRFGHDLVVELLLEKKGFHAESLLEVAQAPEFGLHWCHGLFGGHHGELSVFQAGLDVDPTRFGGVVHELPPRMHPLVGVDLPIDEFVALEIVDASAEGQGRNLRAGIEGGGEVVEFESGAGAGAGFARRLERNIDAASFGVIDNGRVTRVTVVCVCLRILGSEFEHDGLEE